MLKEPEYYLRRAVGIAKDMKVLADEGEQQAPDNGCAVLFGVIRDCAYRIQGRAEDEEEVHRTMGNWGRNAMRPDGDGGSKGRKAR